LRQLDFGNYKPENGGSKTLVTIKLKIEAARRR